MFIVFVCWLVGWFVCLFVSQGQLHDGVCVCVFVKRHLKADPLSFSRADKGKQIVVRHPEHMRLLTAFEYTSGRQNRGIRL